MSKKNGCAWDRKHSKGCFGGTIPGKLKKGLLRYRSVIATTNMAGTVGNKIKFKYDRNNS